MRRTVVGVMGPGNTATATDLAFARELGAGIAAAGWVLLNGGRASGVMEAASQGGRAAGGLVVGILPDADARNLSKAVDIAICTDMGSARNNINVLSSDAIVACGMGAGTTAEVALALKANKPVILLNWSQAGQSFLQQLAPNLVQIAETPADAIALLHHLNPAS